LYAYVVSISFPELMLVYSSVVKKRKINEKTNNGRLKIKTQ